MSKLDDQALGSVANAYLLAAGSAGLLVAAGSAGLLVAAGSAGLLVAAGLAPPCHTPCSFSALATSGGM